jgi:hypothetical protein
MIHIIKHHIKKGSYAPWYDLINFPHDNIKNSETDISYFISDDWYAIERANYQDKQPPYPNLLEEHISDISPKQNDIVIFDIRYLPTDVPGGLEQALVRLSNKYKIKLVVFDDDCNRSFIDTKHYTIFSNKFRWDDNEISINLNYYRYRAKQSSFFKNLPEILSPFTNNIREKKINLIVGVDKPERFEIFKYVHNIGLDKDSYLAYSAFCSTYNDDILSDRLLKWKQENIPTILDTTLEKSAHGSVNPDIPPIPYCMNSYVSCILETNPSLPNNEIQFSEKTWNPFLSFNIPLILNGTRSNQYLKKLGFWLADSLFDLTPKDTFKDVVNQYKSNLDILNKISNLELRDYYIKNSQKLQNNYDIIMKQKFYYNKENYKHHTYKEYI